MENLCSLRGTAAPQSLLPAALLETGFGVARASGFPREAGNSGLDGKSLRGDVKEEGFLGQTTVLAKAGSQESPACGGNEGVAVPRLLEQGGASRRGQRARALQPLLGADWAGL